MKKVFFVIIGVFLLGFRVFSQELYRPRNILAAYARGTRSNDGNPGKNYWQNKGKYVMDIKVDPSTRIVSGQETIHYSNNSPDTLKSLAIRFVNNLHKPGAVRGGINGPDFLTDGLTIHLLEIGGESFPVDTRGWGTVERVKLTSPVLPRSSVDVKINWEYPLSKESGREGQIDSTTFYVAYSYPRISVYDDYNGWDLLPHNGRQEFYNDFNNYAYQVSVPKNYVVWATGDLLNADEVLQPQVATRLKTSYAASEVLHIATAAQMKAGQVTLQKEWNTWKFAADHISDVCFGLSNHYIWDASSTLVDRKTGRRASTQAAYDEKGTDFVNSVKYNSYALNWFSENWPGVPYPFSKMTAFQGFADMEFPMMVNDSNTGNDAFGRFVQDHEIAHTYFPFYMGINETRYAYMDEGWATTLEYLIGKAYRGKEAADSNYIDFRVKRYIYDTSTEEDQPIITMSSQESGSGYGNNAYGKPSLAYLALKDLLGDELFKKALHRYMDAWNGKHPIPWDFFNAMNAGAGQNLNWFWQNWFFTNNYIDLRIAGISDKAVEVDNVGGFAIPFDVVIIYKDGTRDKFHQSPAIWKSNPTKVSVPFKATKGVNTVVLDGGLYLDPTPADNQKKI
ncbi:hypothetical protein SAMN05216436_10146 [bacterium A37T11]|nr:hypothetical protein SAMN05216436_10146 [bacterium A37T11]